VSDVLICACSCAAKYRTISQWSASNTDSLTARDCHCGTPDAGEWTLLALPLPPPLTPPLAAAAAAAAVGEFCGATPGDAARGCGDGEAGGGAERAAAAAALFAVVVAAAAATG